jgi:hypothetical protein
VGHWALLLRDGGIGLLVAVVVTFAIGNPTCTPVPGSILEVKCSNFAGSETVLFTDETSTQWKLRLEAGAILGTIAGLLGIGVGVLEATGRKRG